MQRSLLLVFALLAACVISERIPIAGFESTYEVTKEGSGEATVSDGVDCEVHTTGYLQEGKKKFWSTFDNNQPMPFTPGNGSLIKGFEAGIQGAKVGESRTVYIPASEGYGAAGAGDVIPANSDLIFEIAVTKIGGKGEGDL